LVILASGQLARRERGEVGAMAFAGVVDWEATSTEGGEEILETGDDLASCPDVVALETHVAFQRADCNIVSA
jgi:hypothetical protein